MTFTNRYPTEVAGLVYLDASDPDMSYADFDAISPEARRFVLSELDVFPPDMPVGMKAEIDKPSQAPGERNGGTARRSSSERSADWRAHFRREIRAVREAATAPARRWNGATPDSP
jgi:hypothetical protein